MGFAGKVAFAFVFDERDVSAADDVGCLSELDVRGAVPEPIYAQAGEGDEIFLFSARRKGNGEHCMSDLLDDDGARCEGKIRYVERSEVADIRTAETGLLRIVAHEAQPFRPVLDDVGSDGWMVGDLLDK